MKRTIFFFLCMLGIGEIYTRAQSTAPAGPDLKHLTETLNKRRYTYRVTYTLYNSYRSLKPLETQVLDVKMWDLMVNIKSRHFHIIKNMKQYLYVDPDQKTLMLNPVNNYYQDLNELKEVENMLDIDTILSMYSKVDELKTGEGAKGYRFHIVKGLQYAYSDIIFNVKTGNLEKVILYYARNLHDLTGDTDFESDKDELPRLEMDFSNFIETTSVNEQFFSIKPFLNMEGEKIIPSANYKDYTFINNTY
jgi:hypothetical protein